MLSIHHFNRIPDIAADIADAGALRAFYRTTAESNGLAMIEVDSTQVLIRDMAQPCPVWLTI